LIIKIGDNMFDRHLIINSEKEKSLYLFINFNYEFSRDLSSKGKKERTKTLYEKVIDYIKKNKIDFTTGKVFLVVGGIIIGTLFLSNYQFSDIKNAMEPKYTYVEQIDIFNDNTLKNNVSSPQKENTVTSSTAATNNNTSNQTASTNTKTTTQTGTAKTNTTSNTTTKQPQTSTSNQTNQLSTPTSQPAPVSQPTQTTQPTQTQQSTPTQETTTAPVTPPPVEKMVTLYRSTGTVEQISLEDYVIGVVGAEMPASFSLEALKAQSVLARTYALKKISQNQVLSDTTSNQVYKDVNQLKSLWGSSFDTYYNKIKSAVSSTKDQYLAYNGNYIEAVYHSTSNGQTEDAAVVWGNSFPYLVGVDSHWDLDASSYLRETVKEYNVLSSILGIDFNVSTNIEVLSRTSSNRIDKIEIDGNVYTGIELRNLLGLRSTDFDIKEEDNDVVFVTRGYGHGVGMSQYGANGMAKEGYSYTDILAHYYPNTVLENK
jgi:stage II sporulation protein D